MVEDSGTITKPSEFSSELNKIFYLKCKILYFFKV